jgi:hypothetical protein
MNSALGNGTATGDLMLAQSQGMEPQNFLQLAHGQPLLWQRGSFHLKVDFGGETYFKWIPTATAALRRHSNPMPITVPNYNRKTDRHQFGTLIGITSES